MSGLFDRVGDILPVFNCLYRVKRVHASGRRGGDAVHLVSIEGGDLPRHISVQPGSFILPLRHGHGRAMLQRNFVFVDRIEAPGADDKRGPLAEVRTTSFPRRQKTTTVRVRRGDVLRIGGIAHKVRNIVPRDEARQIIGWVEIAAKPLADKDKSPK